MMRSDGDLVTIERSLGLKSERGISRQGNKDNPIIQELLADIKNIALQYTDKANTEIRASSVLEQNSLELFGKYGPLIWPSADQERPNWLAEPSAERYDGKYPRALHHDVPEENQILSELFHALVVEKCVKYHDNQLQKARRLTRKSEVADYEPEGGDVEYNGNTAGPGYAVDFGDSHGGHVHSPASAPHGPPYSDDPEDELDSQDEDVFSDESDSRTKSQRLQDYRDEIARASESLSHAADGNMDNGRKRRRKHGPDGSSKRMREIRHGNVPKESLIVQLQVNREALSRLVGQKSVQKPDVSHRESAPRDEHRDAIGATTAQEHGNTRTPPPPLSPAHQLAPATRRSSGFQAINASNDALPAAENPAHAPVAAPLNSTPSVPAAAPVLSIDHQAASAPPAQPPNVPVPFQQAPVSRRPSAANPAPLRIVPVEVPASEGQQRPSSAREHPNSSELSDQSYSTAQTHTSGRSSAQPANDGHRMREQAGTKPVPPRNGDAPQPLLSQTAAPHHPIVQPLTSQPPAPFRDHAHGHHAFRVHRPFIPQQQQHQQHQQHQHQHQHQPPQHQLQHQFSAHAPPVSSHQQRHVVAPQPSPHHQHVPPRQLLPANNFPPHQQAPPVRRPSPHQILQSNGRRTAFVEEILGDLMRCPVVTQILAADSNLDAQQLNNLKTILTNHPETRDDMDVLLTRMNSLMSPAPPKPPLQHSPDLNMRANLDISQTLGNPGHLQRTPMPMQTPPMGSTHARPSAAVEQSPRMKSEPMEEDKLMSSSPHPGSFENVSIEINWGRQLEYSDYMEMQYCSTTKDFFGLVEAHIPDEISADGHTIKEIRVKALKDLKGGNLLPRIVRDEVRGRAAIRQLVKRLKAQPPDSEPELMFVIVWNDK